jgi:hypothetical protein
LALRNRAPLPNRIGQSLAEKEKGPLLQAAQV